METHSKILSVKVPVALAEHALAMRKKRNVYETNGFIKNIAAWLILKAATPYGLFKNYKEQIDYLASITQCERQTFKKRVAWFIEQGLATVTAGNLQLVSFKDACALYYCGHKKTQTILYEPSTDKNFYLRLFAIEITDNKEKQRYMIETKLKRNLALKQTIQVTMLKHGADQSRIEDFRYIHNGMQKLYRNSFKQEPELHALLNKVRPDCNRSIRGIARAWDFKSLSLVSYYKRKFQDAGIAVVTKGERIESRTRSRNNDCNVIWNQRKKQTVLCLVDAIIILEKKPAA